MLSSPQKTRWDCVKDDVKRNVKRIYLGLGLSLEIYGEARNLWRKKIKRAAD